MSIFYIIYMNKILTRGGNSFQTFKKNEVKLVIGPIFFVPKYISLLLLLFLMARSTMLCAPIATMLVKSYTKMEKKKMK